MLKFHAELYLRLEAYLWNLYKEITLNLKSIAQASLSAEGNPVSARLWLVMEWTWKLRKSSYPEYHLVLLSYLYNL